MRPSSTRGRLLRAFVVIGTLPVLLLGAVAGWYDYQARLDDVQTRLQQHAAAIAARAAAVVDANSQELQAMARLQGQELLDPARRDHPPPLLVADRTAYGRVVLMDAAGHPLLLLSDERWIPANAPGDFSGDGGVRQVAQTLRPFCGAARVDPADGESLVEVAVPLVRQGEALAGVLWAELRLRPLWDLAAGLWLSPGEEAYLIDGDGRVVARTPAGALLAGQTVSRRQDSGWQEGLDGGVVLAATHPVDLGPGTLTAVVELARGEVLRPLVLGLRTLAAIAAATLATTLLMFTLAIRRIIGPVKAVARAARAVADGDLSATAPVRSADEIGELAEAFNTMAAKMRTAMEEAQAEIEERRHAEGQLLRLNRAHHSLARCSQLTMRATEADLLLEEVCRIVAEDCGYPLVWVALAHNGGTATTAASAGYQDGRLTAVPIGCLDGESGCWPAGEAILGFTPVIANDLGRDDSHPAARDDARRRGFSACAAIPFRIGSADAGAICIYAAERNAFSPEEVQLLGDVAASVGFGLSTLRLRTERDESRVQLQRARDRFELLLRSAAEGICGIDRDGRTTFVNRKAADLTGWSEEELLGHPHHALLHHHRADGTPFPAEDCPVLAAMAESRTATVDGEVFWRKDGSAMPVQYTCAPVVEDGRVTGTVLVFHDVSVRKRMEEEVARSNADLTQFAHAISHDLQEPLRMVGSFLGLLERHHGASLDDEGREFIRYAVDGSRRMSRMIGALLDYSRIHSAGAPLQPVDMTVALKEALANLTVAVADSGAQVESAPLPLVHGDFAQMSRLLQNLIGNALKYRRPDAAPVVRVSATATADGWEFAVADNGIGIASGDFERIFGMFQRLHRDDEIEGSGVGLALCRRIVQRHGGRIWVTSTPGEGSVFRFTLPRIDQAAGRATLQAGMSGPTS